MKYFFLLLLFILRVLFYLLLELFIAALVEANFRPHFFATLAFLVFVFFEGFL